MTTATALSTPRPNPASATHAYAGWGLLLLPGLIWGGSFFLIAQGLQALAPDGITFLRFLIGFVALAFVPGARQPVAKADRRGVFWLGIWWMAFPMSMFPHAEQFVSSALTGMLNGAIPLLATAVAAFLARKVPPKTVLTGLGIGFGGCILMAVPGMDRQSSGAGGLLLILAALLSYACAINLAKPLQQRNGALPVVWRALAVALVVTAPLGIPAVWHAQWNAGAFLAVLALGLLGTAGANVIMAVAAGRLGAPRASTTTFLIPVVALLLGICARGETIAPVAAGGVAMCLSGAWIVRRGSLPSAPDKPTPTPALSEQSPMSSSCGKGCSVRAPAVLRSA